MERIVEIRLNRTRSPDPPDLFSLGMLLPPNVTPEEKLKLVLRLLRQAALDSRGSKGKRFYSIRAVAKQFTLSPTTVARLYGQLRDEGLLGGIWGSKTIIEPAQLDAGISLKGTIGLPVSLDWFGQCHNYRDLIVAIQETLWLHGFGVRTVFFRENPTELFQTIDRLCRYRVNRVVWIAPSAAGLQAAVRLRDNAIACTIIHGEPPINGSPGYYISVRRALADGLAAWKRLGIANVMVVDTDRGAPSIRAHCCKTAVTAAGMRIAAPEDPTVSQKTGLIFVSIRASLEGTPDKCYRASRAMYLQGVPEIHSTQLPGIISDMITIDARKIARHLGTDVASGMNAASCRQTVFEATWRAGPPTP